MASLIVSNGAVQGETFLPRQIFVFGGFVLRANSLGRLEQIDSHAPSHQVRFGSLNYVADIPGDLIFNGFETTTVASPCAEEHDLNLLSDYVQKTDPVATTASEPKQIVPFKATKPMALEPHTDSTPCNACTNGPPDSYPAIGSGPDAPADTELDRLSIFIFSAQTSSSTHLWVTY